MSAKRPIIKFKDKNGRVKAKKMSPALTDNGIWYTLKELHDEIVQDVEVKHTYQYCDLVEIIFEWKNPKKRKQRRYKDEIIER